MCEHTQSLYLANAIKIAIHKGMRLSEIIFRNWTTIDLDNLFITLSFTKNNESRIIPLSEKALLIINAGLELDIVMCSKTINFLRLILRVQIFQLSSTLSY